MEQRKFSQLFYHLFALGISFESFVIMLGAPISVTDITVLFLLSYSLIFHQKILLNWMLFFTLIFGFYIFVANIINMQIEQDFSSEGFFRNYLRVVAVMIMITLIPSLLKEFELKKLLKGILFALKFHGILLIVDPFVIYPWTFSDYGLILGTETNDVLPAERARGLWMEPSYASAFIGMMMVLVLQYERNTKERIATISDYFILFLALLATASVTGASVAGILIIMNLMVHRKRLFKATSLVKTISLSLIAIPIMVFVLASSFVFITDRLSAGLAGGSTLQRLVGSTLFTLDIMEEKPLLGSGLGGKNQQAFLDKYGEPLLATTLQQADGEAVLSQSATTFWAALSGAGGLPTLLIFYLLILGNLILDKRTFFVGTMIFFLGISKGGVFDVSLWFIIAAAVSFRYIREDILEEKLLER